MSKLGNFDPNAILRGAQLTLVGCKLSVLGSIFSPQHSRDKTNSHSVHRALQNPAIFTSTHYRQAALAVAAGIAIRLILAIPIIGVRGLLWILSLVVNMDHAQWDDSVSSGLHFLEHSVLQVPFFLMTLMRYITPTLDQMFMDSLRWVDQTYVQKHKTEDPHNLRAMYYPNLQQYPMHAPKGDQAKPALKKTLQVFAIKYGRKAGISLTVLALSYLPYVGRFVLPAASFYTFQNSVGPQPALAIFATSLVMPRRYLVTFLQTYFSSRTLMRELVSGHTPFCL
jgi:hypothetical protein